MMQAQAANDSMQVPLTTMTNPMAHGRQAAQQGPATLASGVQQAVTDLTASRQSDDIGDVSRNDVQRFTQSRRNEQREETCSKAQNLANQVFTTVTTWPGRISGARLVVFLRFGWQPSHRLGPCVTPVLLLSWKNAWISVCSAVVH